MALEDPDELVGQLLNGDHRALARAITHIEDRTPGYRDLVGSLYGHVGSASVLGVTGSPGSGKSTLVDKLAARYRDRGETVGVIAVDPSSPYTGGAVLGDRIRMGSNVGDMDVFVRSMSARGSLGGLSTATADAVKALDAFGKDRVIIETVGAGQNEIDIVRSADTVAVLVPPGSGDDVQMLKAGILEIGDVFVVNKADKEGADRTVRELQEMISLNEGGPSPTVGHHGPSAIGMGDGRGGDGHHDGHSHGHAGTGNDDDHEQPEFEPEPEPEPEPETWDQRVVETVATDGTGVEALVSVFDEHYDLIERTGELAEKTRSRYAEEIRTLLREDVYDLLEAELDRHGGVDALAEAVRAGETDPYSIADEVLAPLRAFLDDRSAGGEVPDPTPDASD
jgi:LAO/AO transport system kinase